jgi:hypothetical protein
MGSWVDAMIVAKLTVYATLILTRVLTLIEPQKRPILRGIFKLSKTNVFDIADSTAKCNTTKLKVGQV